jgi:hypothetical protein
MSSTSTMRNQCKLSLIIVIVWITIEQFSCYNKLQQYINSLPIFGGRYYWTFASLSILVGVNSIEALITRLFVEMSTLLVPINHNQVSKSFFASIHSGKPNTMKYIISFSWHYINYIQLLSASLPYWQSLPHTHSLSIFSPQFSILFQ